MTYNTQHHQRSLLIGKEKTLLTLLTEVEMLRDNYAKAEDVFPYIDGFLAVLRKRRAAAVATDPLASPPVVSDRRRRRRKQVVMAPSQVTQGDAERWAAENGLFDAYLTHMNAKRADFNLPPFEIMQHGYQGDVLPASNDYGEPEVGQDELDKIDEAMAAAKRAVDNGYGR